MKDVNQLGTQYFDIPTKEIANHITKWLAIFKFKERGNYGWTDKNRRIFFTYPDNEYLFTSTEDNQSWEELYDYGMPEYTDNQISTSKNTLTENNIRDFYFEVNNQTEADDALEILEKAGEGIYIKGLAFLYDSWRYIIYENGNGWKLSCKSIGKRSTYQELVNLYEPSREQSHFNVNINGSEETIKPNSATSPKKVSDLKYPDVVHIQSEQEYGKLHKVHSNMNKWNSKYSYYLIGQGYSEKRKSYENSNYTIYEMDQIIMDEQPKTSDMDIFPGIKIGDIVVSLIEIGPRKVGDMFEVLAQSKKGYLYYLDFANSSDFKTFRLATYEESEEYEKGIRNINKILPVETILERANKMYPIGTKVKLLAGTDGEEVEAIIKEKFILYDNGSISYRSLPGYVYFSKTNQWAKVVGVAHMPENLSNLPNDVDLKCKTSKQYINTTIASIPTINKELKQKKQKFYF